MYLPKGTYKTTKAYSKVIPWNCDFINSSESERGNKFQQREKT